MLSNRITGLSHCYMRIGYLIISSCGSMPFIRIHNKLRGSAGLGLISSRFLKFSRFFYILQFTGITCTVQEGAIEVISIY